MTMAAVWSVGSVMAQPAAVSTNGGTPKIQFATMSHDFGRLSSGQVARHDFIFTNTGNAVLEITSVKPACGCTTAGEWSKLVEPGQTGTIALQFNSAGFSGMVVKTATITCTDPAASSLTLQMSGNVWKEVDVIPQFAVLNGNSESFADAKTAIKVVNNGETPLEITGWQIDNSMFIADLKTNQPGKEYELQVRAVPPLNTSATHGIVTLKTSSPSVPTVAVTAMLMLQPVISVTPAQVNLPPPPLNNGYIHTITVNNAGTNSIKLGEVTVSDSRITAATKETTPGKAFSVEINIPQGFVAKAGQPTEVAIKTTHPQFPEVKIGVVQALPAAAAPGVPAVIPPAHDHAH